MNSYALDTAYRDPTNDYRNMTMNQEQNGTRPSSNLNKTYNDRITKSRDRPRMQMPYQNNNNIIHDNYG